MELARSEEATSDLGRTILPALNAVEGHLAQVSTASAQLGAPMRDTLLHTDAR
jgi:hypothetical protein